MYIKVYVVGYHALQYPKTNCRHILSCFLTYVVLRIFENIGLHWC